MNTLLKTALRAEYLRARYELDAWLAGVATAVYVIYPYKSVATVQRHFTISAHTARVKSERAVREALGMINPESPAQTSMAEPQQWET